MFQEVGPQERAKLIPKAHAPMQSTTFKKMFIPALMGCPDCNNSRVSNEKAEKVVNAPSRPTSRPALSPESGAKSLATLSHKYPMVADPSTLTTKVPMGNPRPSQ